jgi:hypothetical protein
MMINAHDRSYAFETFAPRDATPARDAIGPEPRFVTASIDARGSINVASRRPLPVEPAMSEAGSPGAAPPPPFRPRAETVQPW